MLRSQRETPSFLGSFSQATSPTFTSNDRLTLTSYLYFEQKKCELPSRRCILRSGSFPTIYCHLVHQTKWQQRRLEVVRRISWGPFKVCQHRGYRVETATCWPTLPSVVAVVCCATKSAVTKWSIQFLDFGDGIENWVLNGNSKLSFVYHRPLLESPSTSRKRSFQEKSVIQLPRFYPNSLGLFVKSEVKCLQVARQASCCVNVALASSYSFPSEPAAAAAAETSGLFVLKEVCLFTYLGTKNLEREGANWMASMLMAA